MESVAISETESAVDPHHVQSRQLNRFITSNNNRQCCSMAVPTSKSPRGALAKPRPSDLAFGKIQRLARNCGGGTNESRKGQCGSVEFRQQSRMN